MGSSRVRFLGRWREWAAAALAIIFAALLLGAGSAHASEPQSDVGRAEGVGQLTASGSLDAHTGDGGSEEIEDYGDYYRIGDTWYSKSTNEPKFARWTDGYVYHWSEIQKYESFDLLGAVFNAEKYYTDGYLYYQTGSFVDMERYKARAISLYLYPNGSVEGLEERYFSKPVPRNDLSSAHRVYVIRSLGISGVFIREGNIRVVVFDGSLFLSREEAFAKPGARENDVPYDHGARWNGFHPEFADCWFKDLYNLQSFVNLERLDTSRTKTMAHMFDGCASLREIDMSGWDTSACIDFTGMFDGCTNVEKLAFGSGWTQAGAGADAPVADVLGADYAGYQVGKATFPADMQDGSGTIYRAGEVIPDGAGVYTTCRTSIVEKGKLRLLRPGSLVVDAATKVKYDANPASLPAGVAPNAVYEYGAVMASRQYSTVTCEYTGGKVVPTAVLEVNGVRLREGRDYIVEAVCDNDAWEGEAHVIVRGIGDYRGSYVVPFTIADTTVHAFLFSDGLLYIKVGRDYPSIYAVGRRSFDGMVDLPWFGAFTYRPGANAPWSAYRTRIKQVVFDDSMGDTAFVSMAGWFDGCTNLTGLWGLDCLDTSRVTTMANLFRNCTALEAIDVSTFSTARATDMAGFVQGCKNLKELVTGTGWNTSASAKAGRAPTMPAACYRMKPSEAAYASGAAIPSGEAEYRFGDIAMQATTRVVMDRDSYPCTGKPIEPAFDVFMGNVRLQPGHDYVVGYTNNLHPGNAQAIILGRGLFAGGLIVPFKIAPSVTKVGDRLTYKTKTATYVLKVTGVKKKNGKVVSVTTEAIQIIVMSSSTKTITLPSECTIGGLNVTVTAVGSKLSGKFRNVTCIVVGPKVTKIGARAFSKAPKVKKLKVRSARLKSVKNCLAGSKVTTVTTGCKLSNARRLTYQKWFMKGAGKKGVRFIYMTK